MVGEVRTEEWENFRKFGKDSDGSANDCEIEEMVEGIAREVGKEEWERLRLGKWKGGVSTAEPE